MLGDYGCWTCSYPVPAALLSKICGIIASFRADDAEMMFVIIATL